jgi:hypothetical protein
MLALHVHLTETNIRFQHTVNNHNHAANCV